MSNEKKHVSFNDDIQIIDDDDDDVKTSSGWEELDWLEMEKQYNMFPDKPIYTNLKEQRKNALKSFIPFLKTMPPEIYEKLKTGKETKRKSSLLSDIPIDCQVSENKFLDYKNCHENDKRIKFVSGGSEDYHDYYIDGDSSNIMSVTEFTHLFFPHFDCKKQAESTLNSKTYQNSKHRKNYKYFGCNTVEDIEKKWKESRNLGTALHAVIEKKINHETICEEKEICEENKKCFKQFLHIFNDKRFFNFEPFRTEMIMFDADSRLCGTADLICIREDKTFVIIDWKRCDKINTCCFNVFRKLPPTYGFGPCSKLQNANYYTYSLQLNVYLYILQKNYNMFISDMFIIQFHPSLGDEPNVYKLPILQKEVMAMFELREMALRGESLEDFIKENEEEKKDLSQIEKELLLEPRKNDDLIEIILEEEERNNNAKKADNKMDEDDKDSIISII